MSALGRGTCPFCGNGIEIKPGKGGTLAFSCQASNCKAQGWSRRPEGVETAKRHHNVGEAAQAAPAAGKAEASPPAAASPQDKKRNPWAPF